MGGRQRITGIPPQGGEDHIRWPAVARESGHGGRRKVATARATAVPLTTLLIISITLRGRLLAERTSNHGHRVYHKHQLISQTRKRDSLLLIGEPIAQKGSDQGTTSYKNSLRELRPELQRSRHERGWVRDDAIGVLHPLAHPSPRVARINHLFHLEAVERADGSPRALDTRIDLSAQRRRIGGLSKLAFVGGLDAAFRRDAANICGRPHNARTGSAARRRIVVARDPKASAHDDGEDRDRELRERDHPFATLADGAGDLMLETHREARIVDQVQHWEMEQVAEVEMALELVTPIGRERAPVDVPAIRGEDAHRIAIEAYEANDLVGSPERPNLEERAAIRHQPNRPAHVEGHRALAGDEGEQLFLPAINGVGWVGRQNWRRFVDARWKVGEKPLRHRSRFFLRLREVVDGTVTAMDLPAPQLLLRDVIPHRVAHHRRSRHEQLCDVAHHDGEMPEDSLRGADAHHTAEQHIDHGHLAKLRDVHRTAEVARQERAALAGDTRATGGDGPRAFLRAALAGLLLLRHHRGDAAAAR